MDDDLIRLFQVEITMQCRFVVLSAADLERALIEEAAPRQRYLRATAEARAKRDASSDPNAMFEWGEAIRQAQEQMPSMEARNMAVARIWLALQSIVVSGANLSKLLWGSGGRREAERAPLRESLSVDDASVLRDPDLRNDFEHFDERLALRSSDPNAQVWVFRSIGRINIVSEVDDALDSQFGQYDPESGTLSFWSHSVNVPAIVAEAARILPLAEAAFMRFPDRPAK